jgi:hypothetical protein
MCSLYFKSGDREMARRKNFTEKHKVNAVREFQGSGLTAREFCKQRGMAGSTFSVWNKRLAPLIKVQSPPKAARRQKSKSDQGMDFVPVTLIETNSISSTPPGLAHLDFQGSMAVEMVLPSGGLIRLATNCPPSFVAAALAVMAVQ